MTQYVINIGTIPNDGTGDPLRTAFNETNLNFDQVFAAGPVLSNIQIANNTILTTNTNGNLVLAPNGVGVVQANVNIVPNTSNIRNLGAADRRWSTLYIQYANISGTITVSDLTATGNVTVGGNLSVTGNVINIGNIVTDAKTIQLANTAGTANAANGSGITVGANDNIATFLFSSTANAWTTNIGLNVTGNIIPAVSNTYSLGNSTNWWSNVWVAGNTIYIGGVPLGIAAGNVLTVGGNAVLQNNSNTAISTTGNISTGNVLTGGVVSAAGNVRGANFNTAGAVNATGNITAGNVIITGGSLAWANASIVQTSASDFSITGDGQVTVRSLDGTYQWTFDNAGNLTAPGNIGTSANVSANYFLGNGSQLTGINVATSSISNGNSNVDIATADGDVTVTADGTNTWTFGTNGTLTLAGDITAMPVGFPFTGTITNITTGDPTVIVDLGTSPFGAPVTGKVLIQGVVGTEQANEVWYYQAVEANQFQLFNDAACTIPVDGTSWTAYGGGGTAYASAYDSMAISTGGLQVVAGSSSWYFGMDGNLNLAGGITSDSTIAIDNRASGNGADINLYAADDILLQARDRTLGSGSEGGDINIYAGDSAEDGDASGGDVQIFAGNGGAANVDFGGSGGFVTVRAGIGGDASTGVGGASASGGGALTLSAGDAGSNMGNIDRGSNGGDVSINAGDSTGNNSSGGDIFLNTGSGGANALSGGLFINIPESGQGPGGSWTFDGAGNLNASGNVTGENLIANSNFVGTRLATNLTSFNWSDSIVGITLGANTLVQLDNNVFGDPYNGQVTIQGVLGATEANGNWYYAATDSAEFELFSDANGTPVDSTSWDPYTSGGLAFTTGYANLELNGQNITIRSDHGDYDNKIWSFNSDGGTIFPTLTVTRGDRTGTLTGQTLLFGDSTQQVIISTPNGTSDINASQRLVINPGAGYAGTTGEGGDIYLYAGRGGDAGGSGGDIKIRGGLGPVDGAGGYLDIMGGEAAGNGVGGRIDIQGGQSGNSNGGDISIVGGQGINGGDINIQGGTGTAGQGGDLTLQGGISSNGLAEYGNVIVNSGASQWQFNNTGNLTLPRGGIVYETTIPGGVLSGNTIALKPSGGTNTDQQLLIYPTADPTADANHLHLTSGNLYNTELFLGNDNLYVKLANTGNIVINSNDDVGNTAQWTFGANGNLTVPGGIVGSGASPAPYLSGFDSVSALTLSASGNVLTGGRVSATGNITGGNLITAGSGGAITMTGGNITGANVVTANSFVGNGATLSNVATQVTGSWNVPVGNSTQSFTVPINNTYQLWVLGNIPNGIIVYNATVSVSNTNVPVIGQQFAWNYEGGGNILMFTSIPAQFVGTAGTISNAAPAVANTNVFTFGINNTSGNSVTVNYGYTKIS